MNDDVDRSFSIEPLTKTSKSTHASVGHLVKLDPESADSGGWEEF
ncbi:MAG: hypothetical protein Q8K42_04690 [Methylobacter sp.]|nr:hypothetical protein [Methylobacter sp.]